jgi:predicted nucleic acid-binding protein
VITAVDTGVLSLLWHPDPALSEPARQALERAYIEGALVMCPAVYAELLAGPGRSPEALRRFLEDTGIETDWQLGSSVWEATGLAFQAYAERRSRSGGGRPRRILADFLIGAHALYRANRLLSTDDFYRTAFPRLALELI